MKLTRNNRGEPTIEARGERNKWKRELHIRSLGFQYKDRQQERAVTKIYIYISVYLLHTKHRNWETITIDVTLALWSGKLRGSERKKTQRNATSLELAVHRRLRLRCCCPRQQSSGASLSTASCIGLAAWTPGFKLFVLKEAYRKTRKTPKPTL
jgi:hypothetical protein